MVTDAGLCERCRHAHIIEAARSTFHRCMLHEEEPERFPRYPELPVLECDGYDPGEPQASSEGG